MKLELTGVQTEALTTSATEILFGGSKGGGKSHLMRAASILYSLYCPGLITYLFRRSYSDLRQNHLIGPTSYPVLLKELVEKREVSINYSDNSIKFKNGSMI